MNKKYALFFMLFSLCLNIFMYVICLAETTDKIPTYKKEDFIASANTKKVLKIGLVDCIAFALRNNSEIKIKKIEPRLKESDIKIARSDFEPSFDATYKLRDNTNQNNSTAYTDNTINSRDEDINAGLSGKLYTGTKYNMDFLNNRSKDDPSSASLRNDNYTSEAKITITQPLLKGFGVQVNRADITIAKNDKNISEEDFENTVADIITKTKAAYYNYIFYTEKHNIAKSSLKRAEDMLQINNKRYKAGLVSSLTLLETKTAVAKRQKNLISAESTLKKSEDELKLITSLVDDPSLWNTEIVPLDKPVFTKEYVDLARSLSNAFQYRPDYASEEIALENRDIKIKKAKNVLFPTLDLVGSFGLNGLGDNLDEALSKVGTGDYEDWSIGLNFKVPLGNKKARGEYNKKKLEKIQALISFKRLEQNIILEVRDKVREVDIQYRQVEASSLSREAETQNYNVQNERYTAGEVSTHDMLDYQERLSQAELDYIKALIDHEISIINLDKSEGLTLVKNDIKLER
ncbi:MAG: TolC family protein [bacterium]|nr:TolC family protein [bacterium]